MHLVTFHHCFDFQCLSTFCWLNFCVWTGVWLFPLLPYRHTHMTPPLLEYRGKYGRREHSRDPLLLLCTPSYANFPSCVMWPAVVEAEHQGAVSSSSADRDALLWIVIDHHGFHSLRLCPVCCSPVSGENLDEESAYQAACRLGVQPGTVRRGGARPASWARPVQPGVSVGGFPPRGACCCGEKTRCGVWVDPAW